MPRQAAFLLGPGRDRGRRRGFAPWLVRNGEAGPSSAAAAAFGKKPTFPDAERAGDAEGQSCRLCRCVFRPLEGVMREGAADGRRGPFRSLPGACVFRGIKISEFHRRRGLLTGLAGAVVVVLQLVDGEGCSPLAQELIKERVAPERLSNEFWPSWFDCRSSWELPDLREGRVKAISDSDGVSYPWYGNTTETVTLVGPTNKISRFSVSMNDNFYPSVTWAVPVSNSNVPLLTRIKRDQSFTTWLVAMNTTTKEKIILQTIKWRMRVDIEVDPMQLLGQRARLVGRTQQEQPRILSRMEPIPPNALVKPNANDAQVLMWRPKRGQPIVVIPPK
ncbi:hypothetical protein QYF61_001250 [Mycteria americana]|uniref:Protein FAM78B n=1 Tax=Mycteria americana TaxID=33587 RepID=A0AAN7N0D5_MYCAM|nr:hypothetical protein QYF61_001250 [Mycteria americana]